MQILSKCKPFVSLVQLKQLFTESSGKKSQTGLKNDWNTEPQQKLQELVPGPRVLIKGYQHLLKKKRSKLCCWKYSSSTSLDSVGDYRTV